jgi:hypothetical protein
MLADRFELSTWSIKQSGPKHHQSMVDKIKPLMREARSLQTIRFISLFCCQALELRAREGRGI